MDKITYCFDIDNTICVTGSSGYADSKPDIERIDCINSLYDAGNTIFFLTARGMGRSDNNQKEAYKELYDLTKNQLDSWNVKYHQLFLGKPCADIFVDDRGCLDTDFFSPII
jgi:hypothetical protein